ncbi:hypothetical protein G6F46_012080 [Rhizopus delemar]|uniref:Uncharacterized protein n=3 Tax=Rhizopus TaxID=4842 RepID=I1CTZ6_RHIO9|nr:hypothetical protein RO3G_16637 [Rhizopus delemar RA 99-880]KAG1165358.1 hypothetical protein G6F36_013395 [Rhizopus arrhizus]KAG1458171.1 hypothetical protein G6F55_005496 [Rhizopus delemar]KAG1496844.1 hypothetical protein G6F54_006190 [Rhizopus delemar]KAG1497375.1 hypothetical protein G6F53_011984 [Rhizopus delemar]|eukprot:EIE91926.1 hypothetical protein RO3G_16637 [Rhizopus delemar RA 99-880]
MNNSINKDAKTDNYPIGQDAWNRSKESREHPELYSTGYGTVDRPWSSETPDDEPPKRTSKRTPVERSESKEGFGHTVSHRHSPRSIKRDLNDV